MASDLRMPQSLEESDLVAVRPELVRFAQADGSSIAHFEILPCYNFLLTDCAGHSQNRCSANDARQCTLTSCLRPEGAGDSDDASEIGGRSRTRSGLAADIETSSPGGDFHRGVA